MTSFGYKCKIFDSPEMYGIHKTRVALLLGEWKIIAVEYGGKLIVGFSFIQMK